MKIKLLPVNGLWSCFLFAALILVNEPQARATLGEASDSIAKDRQALSARQRAITTHRGYTVHEIVSDSNSIREYISSTGVVFAIAWNGLINPDLTVLLGSYAGEYRKALGQVPRVPGRRKTIVKTNRIVVEKWGHMRDLRGRAYDPALIPQGVTVDEIK